MNLQDRPEVVRLSANQSVLASIEADGRSLIKVGCRRGGCGMCKVKILRGQYSNRKMSRAHISVEEEIQGFVLACRATPESDLLVQVQSETPNEISSNNNK